MTGSSTGQRPWCSIRGQRRKYTGNSIMALFGAPTALEDHAIRACLAALAIQEEANGSPARCSGATVSSCSCGSA